MERFEYKTFLLDRAHPQFPDCHPTVQNALVRVDDQSRPRTYRFLDADDREVTRFGLPLRDFDLEPLFVTGKPDDFVVDGRFETLLAALECHDAFLEPNGRQHDCENAGLYQDWLGRPLADHLQKFVDALARYPGRALVGWQPATGGVQRIGDFLPDPFETWAATELAYGGLYIGYLTRGRGLAHPKPDIVASLLCHAQTATVVTLGASDWQRRTTLGALAFGSGLLTAFEARRVSWTCLRSIAAELGNRFGFGWYAPDLKASDHEPGELAERLPDTEQSALEVPASEPGTAWFVGLKNQKDDVEAVPLPDFDLPQDDPVARLLLELLRAFFVRDEQALDQALAMAESAPAEALSVVAARIKGARHGGELGNIERTVACRDSLSRRWRALHGGGPEVVTPTTAKLLMDEAWAHITDTERIALHRQALDAFPEAGALLTKVEALEEFDPGTADVAWELATSARAVRELVEPFIANAALGGPDTASFKLLQLYLPHWRQRSPARWRPVVETVVAESRFGSPRFRWLVGSGEQSDMDALSERAARLIEARPAQETAFGFDFQDIVEVLVTFGEPALPILEQALAIETLYPVEAARLAAHALELGCSRYAEQYVAGVQLIGNSTSWWRNVKDLALGGTLLSEAQRSLLRQKLVEPKDKWLHELIRRLQLDLLGPHDPALERELVDALDHDELGDEAKGLVVAAATIPWVGSAFFERALEDSRPQVRLAALAATTEHR